MKGEERDFLDLSDAGGNGVAAMLSAALDRKRSRVGWPKGKPDSDAPLSGYVLGMIFEKHSTRTRVSFDVAMRQLGGTTLTLESGTTQLGRGESIADTARVLSRMVDAIVIRTDDHAKAADLARYAEVPVINGLTDRSHPCQIVADLLTLVEKGRALPGLELAWFGDGNNVLHSIIEAAGLFKFNVKIACPVGFEPDEAFVIAAKASGAQITITRDAAAAAKGADVLVTDTWVSMGQEHAEEKIALMQNFRVTGDLMRIAKENALFLHCLPAHVGDEVSQEVFESAHSAVFDEAENRLHAQKAILLWCLNRLA